MTNEEFLHSQIGPMLQPGEQIVHTAYMRRQPGLLMQIFLVGGLLLWMMTKAYYVVLTNRRLILIRAKMNWKGLPTQQNLGVEQFDVRNLKNVTTSGWANNRSMTFYFHQGPPQTLRISPWGNKLGSQAFLDLVPGLVQSGQLAHGQLPAGPPMQQQMQQPMQQPAPMQAGTMHPGTRVMVANPDGSRFPGVVVQAANGQYLCQMPDGNSYWYPAQAVASA